MKSILSVKEMKFELIWAFADSCPYFPNSQAQHFLRIIVGDENLIVLKLQLDASSQRP